MKHPEWKPMKVPKLCPEVKKTNGASSQRLAECIQDLDNHLEDNDMHKPTERPAIDPDVAQLLLGTFKAVWKRLENHST